MPNISPGKSNPTPRVAWGDFHEKTSRQGACFYHLREARFLLNCRTPAYINVMNYVLALLLPPLSILLTGRIFNGDCRFPDLDPGCDLRGLTHPMFIILAGS